MNEEELRTYCDKEAEDLEDTATLDGFDELIEKKLKTNMDSKNNCSQMKRSFPSYISLFAENGVKWIIEMKQKRSVIQVLLAVDL